MKKEFEKKQGIRQLRDETILEVDILLQTRGFPLLLLVGESSGEGRSVVILNRVQDLETEKTAWLISFNALRMEEETMVIQNSETFSLAAETRCFFGPAKTEFLSPVDRRLIKSPVLSVFLNAYPFELIDFALDQHFNNIVANGQSRSVKPEDYQRLQGFLGSFIRSVEPITTDRNN